MAESRRLAKLGAYLRPHWRETTLGILALLSVNGLGVYIPWLIRSAVDQLSASFDFSDVLSYVVPIILFSCAMWLIRMASRIWLFGVGRQVEFDLKQRIFQHLLKLEPAYFATNTAGDLISRATSDVDNVRRLVGFAVLSLANTVFAYALTLPVMLTISVNLTLASLAVYPFMFWLVHLFSNRLRKEQAVVQEELSDISELIQEDISGIALIKIYAQEENERRAFAQKNQQLLTANLQLAKSRNILFPLIGGLANLSSLVIIWLGATQISTGTLAVGDFLALLIYVERLVFPTALLGFTITAYQRGEVSIDRLESILSVKPKIQDEADTVHLPLVEIKGKVTAQNLSYTYPGASTAALDNINFTIFPGETVSIVGAIGSGKSTLANALPRLLDIAPGQLFLDGWDITKISLADLRQAIAYVPQDSFLFSTTIKNNIRYGDPVSEVQDVENVARQAQIDAEIKNFPHQYETIVGERGITLSGGQRQRTALARAMLMAAPILILDDALSSVDNQTATKILDNLSSDSRRKTVIFITHQLSAAATADRIFVMDKGKIVQTGTHLELLQSEGLYKTLWTQHQVEELLR
ncbi:ABC transporter ATP-binding protein [Umezakia ovalisporum]|jgi:ATP-binding cassette subfamily B protein|uniref:ABC transporter ATP-binding protein/permease n=1 Tax=Umezakia ovalisporum FSS-43 TaxID=2740520 RepID=A0ABT6K1D3_9CYAN|nr:ABC transporter ATP-binding protein [Umezakia ovalisporum]MBI1242216.1 ATP-binding cassette domain-containing protein [Nostoc sp. RI_552]MDH6056174.1 ABC transporter ATP-binding protein/permease [Umezakia ovalisporum FSS-43]MDH6065841.1 ABC transporter ATP-binding protein/permease [Umezakia ovalisporum APH033B]MDH6072133.1 ABC transporter ATP-binding protein/permease [Umezakia ovalisporum CobakiLakeA]MDH6074026.1 ABC transporter ATP-binding protein/permease [Umezakia ovalisporum CS-1034]